MSHEHLVPWQRVYFTFGQSEIPTAFHLCEKGGHHLSEDVSFIVHEVFAVNPEGGVPVVPYILAGGCQ
jgi:hypothetical protein